MKKRNKYQVSCAACVHVCVCVCVCVCVFTALLAYLGFLNSFFFWMWLFVSKSPWSFLSYSLWIFSCQSKTSKSVKRMKRNEHLCFDLASTACLHSSGCKVNVIKWMKLIYLISSDRVRVSVNGAIVGDISDTSEKHLTTRFNLATGSWHTRSDAWNKMGERKAA